MVGFAILLTIYSQTGDNRIETDMMLFASPRLCQEQGAEIVERKLAGRTKAGKAIRSVWFRCDAVRGKLADDRPRRATSLPSR